jgi:hypothetical protein
MNTVIVEGKEVFKMVHVNPVGGFIRERRILCVVSSWVSAAAG